MRSALVLCVALVLIGCGGARYAQRGDAQFAAGRYDDAIRSYERAAKASSGPEAARYRALASDARTKAAHRAVSVGDQAFRARDLGSAGRQYKRARGYAPTDPLVVARLSKLLKTRVRIEQELEAVGKELDAIGGTAETSPGDPKAMARWDALIRRAEGLLEWRRDYAKAQTLWNRLAPVAAAVQRKEGARLLGELELEEARRRAERALRLSPDDAEAKALLDAIERRGSADGQRRAAEKAMADGDLAGAIELYQRALELAPKDPASLDGLGRAQIRFVRARLDEAKAARKKRDRRTELLAVRQAWMVNTGEPKLRKALEKAYDRAHKRAIKHFYRQGRKHEGRRLMGAALIAYRTAETLGGGPKDLGKRIERCAKALTQARTVRLAIRSARRPRGVGKDGLVAVLAAVDQALITQELAKVGVVVARTPKAMRRAKVTLEVAVGAFALPRQERQEPRKKKFLDRVEFPPNPAWAAAQAQQAAALAELNGATERLRPLQERVNFLESELARLDQELIKLKGRVRAEDEAHYTNKPKPCPDGTTNCPQSYANRRWAKHLAWYRDKIAKTNKEIATISPDFQAAQESVARAQEGFDKAERHARETPKTVRKEIWKTHAYAVTLHIVDLKGALALRLKQGRRTLLAEGKAEVSEQQVDFSTPGVVIRKQTLEPPRKSRIPDDVTLAATLAGKLVDKAGAPLWANLRTHGERFLVGLAKERRAERRLDLHVRALSTGAALSQDKRRASAQAVLEATGYDWEAMQVDVARIPYR